MRIGADRREPAATAATAIIRVRRRKRGRGMDTGLSNGRVQTGVRVQRLLCRRASLVELTLQVVEALEQVGESSLDFSRLIE